MQIIVLDVAQTLVPVVTAASFQATVTSITAASPGVATNPVSAGSLVVANGDAIVFSGSGSLPTGLTKGTRYFVVVAGIASTTQTYEVSLTSGGAAINTSGSAMSGTITVTDYTQAIASAANTAPFAAIDLSQLGVGGVINTTQPITLAAVIPPALKGAAFVLAVSGTLAGVTSIDVQGSPDNSTWTSYLSGGALTAVGAVCQLIAAGSLQRYFRVLINGQVYNATGTVDCYLFV